MANVFLEDEDFSSEEEEDVEVGFQMLISETVTPTRSQGSRFHCSNTTDFIFSGQSSLFYVQIIGQNTDHPFHPFYTCTHH
jgi:hypothetical protein